MRTVNGGVVGVLNRYSNLGYRGMVDLLLHILVGVTRRVVHIGAVSLLGVEGSLNLLESASACLGHVEVLVYRSQRGAAGEEEVDAITVSGLDDVGGALGHHEVESPVNGRADGHAEGADVKREDLGAEDPRNAGVLALAPLCWQTDVLTEKQNATAQI